MVKWLRALFWLAAVSGAGFAVYSALQRRNEPGPISTVATVATPKPTPAPVAARRSVGSEGATIPEIVNSVGDTEPWVEPVGGDAPPGYPIKVSVKSGIYHVPGGRFYDRSTPDRCYASADDAEADGYRRAKA